MDHCYVKKTNYIEFLSVQKYLFYTVCNRGGEEQIKDLKQINTCRQVLLLVNLFKKLTFRVWCPYRYLVYEDSFSKKTISSLYFVPTMNKTKPSFLPFLCSIDQIIIKISNPKCHHYWFVIEFTDWRYSQLCWYFWPLRSTSAALTFSLVH